MIAGCNNHDERHQHMKTLDWAFVDLIVNLGLPINPGDKIALIGEYDKLKEHSCLFRRLKKRLPYIDTKDVSIFTSNEKFTEEDAVDFDWLFSVRPCSMQGVYEIDEQRSMPGHIVHSQTHTSSEEMLIEIAQKLKKRLLMVPCACHPPEKKVVTYIRKYDCIKYIYSIITKETVNGMVTNNLMDWLVIST
jgi:hypothetical protein